jgi:hypothetical protein
MPRDRLRLKNCYIQKEYKEIEFALSSSIFKLDFLLKQ